MVMHATKLPRLSDGFHDRNEAHPYQTSVDKYPSKSLNAGGTNSNSDHGSSRERERDKSQLHPQHREMPTSGMRHSASPSTGGSRPTSESGSPRTYRNKSYLQRQRDRQQRGRFFGAAPHSTGGLDSVGDGQVLLPQTPAGGKSTTVEATSPGAACSPATGQCSSTSPAENTFNHQQVQHGSNSHPNDPHSSHEEHIKRILAKASEWSEHISSLKKKYYYNCKTEVSQWEKPKEWIERERLQRVVNANEKLSIKDSPKPLQTADSSQAKSSNEKHSSDSSQDRPTSHHHSHSGSDRHHDSHSVSSRQQHDYYDHDRSSRHDRDRDRDQDRDRDRPSNTSSSGNKSSSSSSSSSSISSSTGSNNNSGGHGHPRSTPSRTTPTSTSTPTQSPYGRSQYYHQHYRDHHDRDGGHGNRTEHDRNKDLRSPGSGPSPGQMGGSSLSLATDMYGRLKSLVPHHQGSRNEKLESPRQHGTPSPGTGSAVSPLTPKTHIHHNQLSHSLHPPSSAQRLFPSSHSPSLDQKNASSQQQNQSSSSSHPQGDRTDGAQDRLSNQSPMSIESISDLSSPAPSHPDPSPRAQMSTPVSQQQQQTNSSQTQPQQTVATSVSQVAQNAVVATISTQEGSSKDLPPQADQHSKNVDEDSRPSQASPTLSRKSVSPTHSVSSQSGLQVTTPHKSPAAVAAALASTPLKPITATITPSLIQFYDDTLTRHSINWPADHAERQAQRFSDESHTLGAEYTSQISVDLKFARSLVRALEIQATLQEQRILFLRQQAKDLEKLKSENAYMT